LFTFIKQLRLTLIQTGDGNTCKALTFLDAAWRGLNG